LRPMTLVYCARKDARHTARALGEHLCAPRFGPPYEGPAVAETAGMRWPASATWWLPALRSSVGSKVSWRFVTCELLARQSSSLSPVNPIRDVAPAGLNTSHSSVTARIKGGDR